MTVRPTLWALVLFGCTARPPAPATTPVAPQPTHRSTCLAFSPEGALLAVGDTRGRALFLSLPSEVLHASSETARDPISDLAWAPDGSLLAVASARGVSIRDRADRLVYRFLEEAHPVRAVAFSPDSRTLAVGNADGQVTAIGLPSGAVLFQSALPRSSGTTHLNSPLVTGLHGVHALSWRSDGQVLVVARARQVDFLSTENGETLGRLPHEGPPATTIALRHGGEVLLTGHTHGAVFLFRLGTLGGAPSTPLSPPGPRVTALRLSPHGNRLAIGRDNGILESLPVLAAGRPWRVQADPDRVVALAASPDGQSIASLGAAGQVHFWSAEDGRFLRSVGPF